MASLVRTAFQGTIATVAVSRPQVLNALNRDVLLQLQEAFEACIADPCVRVIVLRGEGDRAFIAGADISEFVGATVQDALEIAGRIRKVTDLMTSCPKPIIASISGFCLGGGFELALACDIRIAADTARFGLPEIKLGILPGGGGSVRLTKMAGSSVAHELAMIGEPIDAARAYSIGLVAAVHAKDELATATAALADKMATRPPFALQQLKSSLRIAVDASMANALDAEVKAFALCYSTADKEEGARAFLEKRSPSFVGS